MKISAEINRSDFKAFTKAVISGEIKGSTGRLRWLKFGFLWLVLVALLVVVLQIPRLRFEFSVASAVFPFALFCCLFLYFFWQAQRRVSPADDGVVLGMKTYEFSDAGVQVSSEAVESFIKWTGILRLRETPTHFFVMYDRNVGLILPKRCLPDREGIDEFRKFVDDRIPPRP